MGAAIAARAIAFGAGERYPSVDALREVIAAARRSRGAVTALDLGAQVHGRLAAPAMPVAAHCT